LFKHNYWGRTGFDSSLEAQAACRGRFVGLVKNRTKKQTQTTKVSLSRLNWPRRLTLDACYDGKRGQQAGKSAERPRRFVNRFRGRSGVGSAPAHGLAPQNSSPDKHVDVCADGDEDRGSIPLASIFIVRIALKNGQVTTGLTTSPRKQARRRAETGLEPRLMPWSRSRQRL